MTNLLRGDFFGDTSRRLRTSSFDYADRIALVPDREVPQHTHDEAHFVFVVRGTYITEARNQPGLYGAGTLIFNPSGTSHRDRFQTDLGRFFTISLDAEISSHIECNYPVSTILDSPELIHAAGRAHGELLRHSTFSGLILEGLGLELAGRLARQKAVSDKQPPRWLLRSRDSIHDRCTSQLTVGELAAEAGVHRIHLARAFRQHFGCSPGEYLRSCRMERIRNLLASTHMPLAELSLEMGFSDQSHLTTAFGRIMSVTPGQYRRLLIS